MPKDLVDRDYSEIDQDLLGKTTIGSRDMELPDEAVAPATGYIFAHLIEPLSKMLRGSNVLYRE